MVEIKLFSRTIHQLTYGELFEFLLAIIESTEPFIAGVSRLQIRYDALKGVFVIYDDGFKRPLTAPETEEIKAFDTQRKGVFILVDDSVRKNAHYSVIAEVKAAAHALLPIFENYAGTPKIEYEGETAAVVNLLQELHKPENVTRIARLGQTENVAALEQINIDFQSLYQTRLKNRYDFKQEGNTRQRAGNLIDELVLFARAVNGLFLTASDPAEITALREIIANVNALMEQFTIIVHRRLGINASKKKDDDTQTPGTNPPAPNNPQQPDTTNPTAPDTPNQNPGTGPHPLDPNEHPSMGEH